jgi:hypothetical protein
LVLLGSKAALSKMLSPETQTTFAVIGAIGGMAGIVGGGFGIASYFNSRRQTQLMESEAYKTAAQEKEDTEWAARFDRLANQLMRMNPKMRILDVVLWEEMFASELRYQLCQYVVVMNKFGTLYDLRDHPRPDQLRAVGMRQVRFLGVLSN